MSTRVVSTIGLAGCLLLWWAPGVLRRPRIAGLDPSVPSKPAGPILSRYSVGVSRIVVWVTASATATFFGGAGVGAVTALAAAAGLVWKVRSQKILVVALLLMAAVPFVWMVTIAGLWGGVSAELITTSTMPGAVAAIALSMALLGLLVRMLEDRDE